VEGLNPEPRPQLHHLAHRLVPEEEVGLADVAERLVDEHPREARVEDHGVRPPPDRLRREEVHRPLRCLAGHPLLPLDGVEPRSVAQGLERLLDIPVLPRHGGEGERNVGDALLDVGPLGVGVGHLPPGVGVADARGRDCGGVGEEELVVALGQPALFIEGHAAEVAPHLPFMARLRPLHGSEPHRIRDVAGCGAGEVGGLLDLARQLGRVGEHGDPPRPPDEATHDAARFLAGFERHQLVALERDPRPRDLFPAGLGVVGVALRHGLTQPVFHRTPFTGRLYRPLPM